MKLKIATSAVCVETFVEVDDRFKQLDEIENESEYENLLSELRAVLDKKLENGVDNAKFSRFEIWGIYAADESKYYLEV